MGNRSEPMGEKDRMAVVAAQRYYLQQATTPELAAELNVSRSTVSRLLAHARAMGWVHIEVRSPFGLLSHVEQQIRRRFDLAHVGSVPTTSPVQTLSAAANAAATYLNGLVRDGSTIAVAWGTTTNAVSSVVAPRPLSAATVVQLNGAGSVNDAGGAFANDLVWDLAKAWGARGEPFPVPAFFDHAETREMLWSERSIARLVDIQAQADMAVFSVGALRSDVPSQVHVGGYLSPNDLLQLNRSRVVGDIATVFYRSDGSTTDIELNSRASGLPLEQLREIPVRLCIAVGVGKAEALAAALIGGYVTHLLADNELLTEVVRLTDSSTD